MGLEPEVVVETGVAEGRSSSSILLDMGFRCTGTLHSIDLPTKGRLADGVEYNLSAQEIGSLVDPFYRGRWNLILGDSRDQLRPLLERLGSIDLFIHDSLHTEEHMMWEYKTAWPFIRPGGILLSHDIGIAFRRFARLVGREYYCLEIVKGTFWGGIRR